MGGGWRSARWEGERGRGGVPYPPPLVSRSCSWRAGWAQPWGVLPGAEERSRRRERVKMRNADEKVTKRNGRERVNRREGRKRKKRVKEEEKARQRTKKEKTDQKESKSTEGRGKKKKKGLKEKQQREKDRRRRTRSELLRPASKAVPARGPSSPAWPSWPPWPRTGRGAGRYPRTLACCRRGLRAAGLAARGWVLQARKGRCVPVAGAWAPSCHSQPRISIPPDLGKEHLMPSKGSRLKTDVLPRASPCI